MPRIHTYVCVCMAVRVCVGVLHIAIDVNRLAEHDLLCELGRTRGNTRSAVPCTYSRAAIRILEAAFFWCLPKNGIFHSLPQKDTGTRRPVPTAALPPELGERTAEPALATRACTHPFALSVCRLARNERLAINEQNCSSCQTSTQKNAGKRYERNSRVESGIVIIKHRNACMKVVRFSFARSSVSPARVFRVEVTVCANESPDRGIRRECVAITAIATESWLKESRE